MRLIDADAARVAINRAINDYAMLGCRNVCIGFAGAVDIIDDAPTIDTVKRGRWITENDEYGDAQYIECSECGEAYCGEYSLEELAQDYRYCPGCGAKMSISRAQE